MNLNKKSPLVARTEDFRGTTLVGEVSRKGAKMPKVKSDKLPHSAL